MHHVLFIKAFGARKLENLGYPVGTSLAFLPKSQNLYFPQPIAGLGEIQVRSPGGRTTKLVGHIKTG